MRILFVFIAMGFYIQFFSQTTSIMTFNIRYNNKNDGENAWDNRKEELAGLINYYHPDLLGLQEVLPKQLKYLSRNLFGYSVVALGRESNNQGEAVPIFFNTSKYELIENKTFWLSETPDSVSTGWDASLTRICTYVILTERATQQKLYFFNAHFDHIGEEARKQSAELILKKVNELSNGDEPVVFIGDLNSLPSSEPVQVLKNEMIEGATNIGENFYGPVGTWNGFDKSQQATRKIDYVFVKNLKVLKYRHIDDRLENNNFISDHYPVISIVENNNLKTGLRTSGNPIFKGWYADPEGIVFNEKYWIFPTYSATFDNQVFFDAFSSEDMVNWEKHSQIIDTTIIKWAKRAMWAPSIVEKDKKYYLFFSANDLQKPGGPYWNENNPDNRSGGIGIAVADKPEGPYKDYLGKPLISKFYNEAQPIDQFVFKDSDGSYYMFYGGWGHCNLGKLNDDFTGFVQWKKKNLFKEITPKDYVEGPFMFIRKGIYYFMWSEGGWGNDTYKVAYAMADNVGGPFKKIGTILQSDKEIATGAGHNSVINTPGTDEWFIVYHRRPIPNIDRDHRVTCIDKLEFNSDGTIKPVKMTIEGVSDRKIIRNK